MKQGNAVDFEIQWVEEKKQDTVDVFQSDAGICWEDHPSVRHFNRYGEEVNLSKNLREDKKI